MNVIFLDFDGVLTGFHDKSYDEIEKRVKILSDICRKYDCKVVLTTSLKEQIDLEKMEAIDGNKFITFVLQLFKKYDIPVIGKTPSITKRKSRSCYIEGWKEDEIRLYLMDNLDIEHYCVLDDDDLSDNHMKSNLDKVRKHLVKTEFENKYNPESEGLLEKHKEEVERILKLDNDIKKMVLKRRNNI